MSRKVNKKRFTSEVNIIDFQPYLPAKRKQVTLAPRNKSQIEYLHKLQNESTSIIFAVGPAGTGKTILAVQYGIKLFQEGKIEKIIVTRPAVSVDEDLGFLPGTLEEKMAPWTKPIFDVFAEYYQKRDITRYLEEGVIEISPLAYMRGRTFKNAYIVADEIQGTTVNQMKMLLTRIGDNSKMVITGDLNQADRLGGNGLDDFIRRMKDKTPCLIELIEFGVDDIERHPVIKEILNLYDED